MLSFLPAIAASFSTLVVSWNDAAEINDLVPNDALVIPCSIGLDVAAIASLTSTNFKSLRFKDRVFVANFLTETIWPAFTVS